MKKILIISMVCCMLSLTACSTKAKEEALAQTTEIVSELGELSFTLNGYWSLEQKEDSGSKIGDSQTYDFSATHTESGTNISVLYDDLSKTEGGTLVRIDDYANAVMESLNNASDYTYQCSEISSVHLHGKEYKTFSAITTEVEGIQHFYMRRIDDNIMIMVITLHEEDKLEEILKLSSKIDNAK